MAEGNVLQRELGSVLDHELEQVLEQREIRHPGIILAVSGGASLSTLRCSIARRVGCWRARIGFSGPTPLHRWSSNLCADPQGAVWPSEVVVAAQKLQAILQDLLPPHVAGRVVTPMPVADCARILVATRGIPANPTLARRCRLRRLNGCSAK